MHGRWSSGIIRPGSGNPITDYRFTGQRQESALGGLYDYGARFYDPALGRFISADTVVPGAGNPQALNRYSYVLNNPLKYTDPTGHKYESGSYPGEACEGTYTPPPPHDITAFELGWLWLTEQCPDSMVFDEKYELTQSLMHDEGMSMARTQFYQRLREGTLKNGTDDTYGYKYLVIPYIREAIQYATGEDRVGFFLGSYTVKTHLNDDRTVTFTIQDPKDMESASRSPLYYVPDFIGLPRSKHSAEGLIMGQEQFEAPSDIFLASGFKDRYRSDPGLFGTDIRLGGHITLTFTWTEPLQVSQ